MIGMTTMMLGLTTLMGGDAWACGGFFCNSNRPVVQAGESIVFAIDEERGKVETHVQISYEGEASEFAWVVPVPGLPEPFIASEALFSTLDALTAKRFQLTEMDDGNCARRARDSWWGTGFAADSGSSPETADSGVGPAPAVVVVDQQQVGPYDSVTLQATSDAALVTWLQDNGYAIPTTAAAAMAPYVAQDSYFFALKLSKDNDAGDMKPLGLRYAGSQPVIPLQLTRVAATPDMPVVAHIFSSGRAVPLNYLHVEVDDAAIDWDNQGDNWSDLVRRAADEAGGQAFATEYADTTSWMQGSIVRGAYDVDRIRSTANIAQFLDEVFALFPSGSPELLEFLRTYLPVPEAYPWSDTNLYNCARCYRDTALQIPFDADALATALDEELLQPRMTAEALFSRYPTVTRLISSVSPDEMTLDPLFGVNTSLDTVGSSVRATMTYICDVDDMERDDAMRTLELSDGRMVLLPSRTWMSDNGMTWDDYAGANFASEVAIDISQLTADGPGTPIRNHEDRSRRDLEQHNFDLAKSLALGWPYGDAEEPSLLESVGCGCSGAGGRAGWWPLLLLLGLRRRR